MKRVLILGAGFGGLAAAHRLKQKLAADDEVILVDRRTHFMMGFHKTWSLIGESPLEAGQRPIDSLKQFGVQVIHDSVTAIDPQAHAAEVGGRRIEADGLIVALGAELAPEAVPGLKEHALNVYDIQEIPRAAQALSEFRRGRLLIGIFGIPYKCPPAPYEMALLINTSFRARGVKANLGVFTPQPMSLPIIGQAGCNVIESRLDDDGINFLPNHKATAVEDGAVVFADDRQPFDLLLAVPPHRPPAVVRQSGLVDSSGWVPVNARTMETQFPGVYAVGDVVQIGMANGKPLPKAGVFAEAMGQVAAERIAASLAGREPDATFAGQGGCYLEVGAGQAMMVTGNFLAEPEPEVVLTEPSRQYLEEKHSFEAQHLQTWFK